MADMEQLVNDLGHLSRMQQEMNEQAKLIIEIIRKLKDGYHSMIVEVTEQVQQGAEMGVQYIDSHVIIEICNKHHLNLGKIFELIRDDGN